MVYLEDSADNKKELYRLYNAVSKELFGVGTASLKVSIEEDLITIRAKHHRATRSLSLEKENPDLKQAVDFQLSSMFKSQLYEKLETELNIQIEAIFRDYDSPTQLAFTNVVMK
ncbi:Uncharacterized conserved protein [Alteribacillus bidgolensis]|uniref:Uncharacterized conserved protein n=2 Tax=Alteribacillus bidgolensis TaxID=930129 RepID=A0A1G8H587_9BACI|nr:Na-translocating system protein MpsC family protein [Alteribacillus bidgolensis]SDI01775.1 Uncharacterized conserved protein [Alteribacillus bidgolensis]